jgi:carotenoid cleavage dioxygenase
MDIHLLGNNAPIAAESDLVPTEIVGELPVDLRGTFVRNGPSPRSGWSPHLFAGDGMVHGIAIENGGARWYRNRYVRTPLLDDPMAPRFDPATRTMDLTVTTANTHVVSCFGRLLALEEGGLPYELTTDLETVGPYDFGGALATAMTAHPKRCPLTGELLFFGYSVLRPYLTFHRADATGALVESRVIEVGRCTQMHDFAITESHVLFLDLPMVFDRNLAMSGYPWRWDHEYGARIGVMPRVPGAEVRWLEIEPCYITHTMNAHDDGDAIVLTGMRIAGDVDGDLPTLHRWRIDLAAGTVRDEPLDDMSTEYPRVRDAEVGRAARFGWTTDFVMDAEPEHGEINRHDLLTGEKVTHRFPSGHTCGEPVPVGEHHLMTFAHDRGRGTSYLAVLDADDVAAGPLAEIHVPVRIPAGFHGTWIPA